jgi:hypothetical protein
MVAILLLSGCASGETHLSADMGGVWHSDPRSSSPDFEVSSDSEVPSDLQVPDTKIVAPEGPTPTPTPTPKPKPHCEKRCTDQGPILCVTDPSSGFCVECLTDSDCLANPGAAGPLCRKNYCECNTDADCAGNVLGSRCRSYDDICGCEDDSDCGAGLKCIGKLFHSKVCTAPCTSDADCAGNIYETVCDPAQGCVECVTSADCKGSHTTGVTCSNTFCRCSADQECAGNLNGTRCIGKVCGCGEDADCLPGRTCAGEYFGDRYCT